jgi:hypothetical protein
MVEPHIGKDGKFVRGDIYNAADEQQVRDRKRTAKDAAEIEREDLKKLLGYPEFRRYIRRLIIERCKVLKSPSSTNGTLQSMLIGRAEVGQELWAEIDAADPFAIPEMMVTYAQEQAK